MAAAIGAGLPINEPVGNMVVDVGGGTSETALISLGGVVALAGGAGRLLRHRRRHPDLHPARVRHRHRRAHGGGDQGRHRLGLADRRRGQGRGARPRPDERPAEDRHPVARGGARGHRRAGVAPSSTRWSPCLGQAPPELAQDLIIQGIHLVGGGGMLRGLDLRLAEETEIPVHLVDAPLECVVLGAGQCIEAYDRSRSCSWAPSADGAHRSASSRSSAAWRTCQSRSARAGARAASTSGPSKGARARTARRRTAGLSVVAREDGGQAAGVADGAERGDGRLAAERVVVAGGGPGEGGPTAAVACPARPGPRPRPPQLTRRGRRAVRRAARRRSPPRPPPRRPAAVRQAKDRRARWSTSATVATPGRASAPRAVARTSPSACVSSARAAASSPS